MELLDPFAKLGQAAISVVMCVCPSARKKLRSLWTDFN
jgi:hypothetical protein